MRLGDLRNIMCVDVTLAEYIDCEAEFKELLCCHSMDIPEEYYDFMVTNIFLVGESLYLLLEPKHEEDRNE